MTDLRFFELVKKARLKKKMTQVEAAREVGVSLAGFRLWESGAGKPTKENRKRLNDILGV